MIKNRNELSQIRELLSRQRYAEAEESIQALHKVDANVESMHLLALTYLLQNRYQSARKTFLSLLEMEKSSLFLSDYGYLLNTMHAYSEAETVLLESLNMDAKNPLAHNNLGVSYISLYDRTQEGQYLDKAEKQFTNVLELQPGHLEAAYNLAAVACYRQDYARAEHILNQILSQVPAYPNALVLMAKIAFEKQEYDLAHHYAYRCFKNTPHATDLIETAYMSACYVCDFDAQAQMEKVMQEILLQDENEQLPPKLIGLYMRIDSDIDKIHMAKKYVPPRLDYLPAYSKEWKHEKIRIGYLLRTLSNFATLQLACHLFTQYDRNKFEVHVYYSETKPDDAYFHEITQNVQACHDIKPFNNREAADLINSHEIDILMVMSGYGKNSRTEICRFRPAKTHVAYLSYPFTYLYDAPEYIIADRTVLPETTAEHYAEEPIYLDRTYQIIDPDETVEAFSFQRAAYGIQEDAILLCSFNEAYKIDSKVFIAWMTILKESPTAVLCLIQNCTTQKENLEKAALTHGVDSNRLIFMPPLPKAQHLYRLSQMDLGLDTFYPCGHTTTSDLLKMGVPLITLKLDSFAGNVSASILHTLSLDELICHNIEEYIQKSLKYANDNDARVKLKKRLKESIDHNEYSDSGKSVQRIERVFLDLFKKIM